MHLLDARPPPAAAPHAKGGGRVTNHAPRAFPPRPPHGGWRRETLWSGARFLLHWAPDRRATKVPCGCNSANLTTRRMCRPTRYPLVLLREARSVTLLTVTPSRTPRSGYRGIGPEEVARDHTGRASTSERCNGQTANARDPPAATAASGSRRRGSPRAGSAMTRSTARGTTGTGHQCSSPAPEGHDPANDPNRRQRKLRSSRIPVSRDVSSTSSPPWSSSSSGKPTSRRAPYDRRRTDRT